MSKFFNRNWKAGFTLVELIVVIAILAILAGIAIPVYSGYIKKANKAADLQLLDAANTAFAAACLENGFNAKDVTAATLTVSGKKITGVSDVTIPAEKIFLTAKNEGYGPVALGAHPVQLGTLNADKVNDSFLKFFGSNTEVELKYFESFTFVDGVFEGVDPNGSGAKMTGKVSNGDGTTTYTFTTSDGTEVTYTISDDAVAAFQASTFGTNMTIGELMGDVTGMVDAMSTALNGGSVIAGMLPGDLVDWGVTADPSTDPDAYKAQLSNAAVLFVAQNTTSATTDSLINALSTGDLNSVMNTDNGVGGLLSNMAGLYGIATGFASSDAAADWSINIGGTDYNASQYYSYVNEQIVAAASSDKSQSDKMNDIMNALGMMTAFVYNNPSDTSMGTTAAFNSYTSSGQMNNDVNGYVSALAAIAANQDALINSGAVESGYGSSDINYILSMILGG